MAWQLHSVLTEQTRGVDAKASFALALETAALGVIVALSVAGRAFRGDSGLFLQICLILGVLLLGGAALAATLSVFPRHAGDGAQPPREDDAFIFYGHLRHWSADRLADRLGDTDPLLPLTRELVIMSRIVWIKQRYVQASLVLAVAAGFLMAVATTLG